MKQLALLVALFCVPTFALAQSTWGKGQMVKGGCPSTRHLDVPPDASQKESRFAVDFCVPAGADDSAVQVSDYVSKSESDYKSDKGQDMHSVAFMQSGDHWTMFTGYTSLVDGTPVSYASFKDGYVKEVLGRQNLNIVDLHETFHDQCHDVGEQDGVAVDKAGNRMYFRYWFGGYGAYAFVFTSCQKHVCDADAVASERLKHVYFPTPATCTAQK